MKCIKRNVFVFIKIEIVVLLRSVDLIVLK